MGKFADPIEIDLNTVDEPELLAKANRLNPELGMNVHYCQGLERLPGLMPVKELLIFPRDIERSHLDSPTATGLTAERMRTVGTMRKIKWISPLASAGSPIWIAETSGHQ
jgi:hypothetical protein